jgi:2-furoyl-CoA dehydrogenase FAD binding subunit
VLPHVGHSVTRNRGTVCGSIAHADPSAELPLSLVALGGEVVLRSAKRRRTLPAEAFITGMLSTAREPDELIEAVRFPLRRPGTGYAFREVAMRHGDFAIAAVAAIAENDRLRIAVGGVADRPVARDWPELEGAALDDALNALAWDLGAADDAHATAQYRRMLVRNIGRQMVEEAKRCRA